MEAKVSAKTGLTAGAGLGVAPILIWLLSMFGVDMPPEVAAAIAGLLAVAVAYFVPAKSGKYVEDPDQDWNGDDFGSMGNYSDQENTEIIELENRGV